MSEIKAEDLTMYLLVRVDLGLKPEDAGKLLGQAMHATDGAVEHALLIAPDLMRLYWSTPFRRKVTLSVPNESTLLGITEKCTGNNFPHFLVTDFGLTVFEGHTITCLAIGPIERKLADKKLNLRGFPKYKGVS
jgi:peptidyl-tRNA hydrolase